MAQNANDRIAPAPLRTTRVVEDAAIAVRARATAGMIAIVAFSIFCVVSAIASGPRLVSTICEREKLPGRGYVECLEAALRDSDRALTEANLRAQARIEARADLAVTQRTRWKNVLEEAQGQFIRFRNFECQNVAPYEGTSGRIGAFEERLACLVEKNVSRTQELKRRYGEQ